MGYNIPGVGEDPNALVELVNPTFKGKVNMEAILNLASGSLTDGTALTSTMSDLNLLSGLVVGAITTGIAKYFEVEITCVEGTAATDTVVIIPAGSVILDVLTYCTEGFNGDTTKTFEVGVTGNTDKYIDPVDCPVTLAGVMNLPTGTNNDQQVAEPVGAATTIIYTYTNTASATAGKMKVKVIYA